MKRLGTLLIALGCVAVLLTLYLILTLSPQEPLPTREETILLAPEAEKVESIHLQSEKLSVTLEKKEGFWELKGEVDFPVDQDIPKNMLAIVTPLKALRKVADSPEDPALYGFDGGETEIRIKEQEAEHRFFLGALCTGREGYYLRLADSKAVYLVEHSVGVAYLHDSRYDLIQTDPIPDVSAEAVTCLTLSHPSGELILERLEEGAFPNHRSSWGIRQNGRLFPADDTKAENLLEKILALKFSACIDHDLSEEESAEIFSEGLGLLLNYEHSAKDEDGNETLTAQSYRLLLSSSEEEVYRCRLSSSKQLCEISKESIDSLLSSATEEMRSAEVLGLPLSQLNHLRFTLSDGSVRVLLRQVSTVSTEEEPATVIRYFLDGKELAQEQANTLLDTLLSLQASAFGSYETKSPLLRCEVHLTDGSSYAVSFMENGGAAAVECNGLCFSSVSIEELSVLIHLLDT